LIFLGDGGQCSGPFIFVVMHKAQVRLEAGESSIGIEIEIEIDSVQFYAGGTGNALPVLRSNKST
jgi:hypothetical protein